MESTLERLLADDPPFRAVAEAIGLGMAYQILVPSDGSGRRFTYVGPSCEAVNGVAPEAAMADHRRLYDLVLPEHRERFAAAEAAAVAGGTPFQIEVAMRRTDGQVRWHRIAARPRRLPDGSTLWDGLQTDITEARLTADELEEQRRRAQMAVEATGLGLWEWDLRSNALAWSERNRALFGVAADEEVTIERYMALVHPEDVAEVRNAYASAREAPGGGDYAVEHRVVTPAGELRWVLAHGRVATDQEGPRLVIGTTLDITERRAADEQRNLLMRELAHRSKNGIAVIMAIVSQTARGMESAQAFEQLLMSRLQAMAQSQDLVTVSGGQPVPLIDVATKTLTPFGLARFDVDAALQAISVPGDVAVGLGLLLHEMATNAVKYGALSVRKGRVGLSREAAVDGLAAFAWRESGGPEVKPGGREGFGTRLLEAALRNQGGKVVFAFEPPGFRACVEFPTES